MRKISRAADEAVALPSVLLKTPEKVSLAKIFEVELLKLEERVLVNVSSHDSALIALLSAAAIVAVIGFTTSPLVVESAFTKVEASVPVNNSMPKIEAVAPPRFELSAPVKVSRAVKDCMALAKLTAAVPVNVSLALTIESAGPSVAPMVLVKVSRADAAEVAAPRLEATAPVTSIVANNGLWNLFIPGTPLVFGTKLFAGISFY